MFESQHERCLQGKVQRGLGLVPDEGKPPHGVVSESIVTKFNYHLETRNSGNDSVGKRSVDKTLAPQIGTYALTRIAQVRCNAPYAIAKVLQRILRQS
ncbi:MAG TPA: hypothetical protein V6C85_34690 [Allocoleopsis sp.]